MLYTYMKYCVRLLQWVINIYTSKGWLCCVYDFLLEPEHDVVIVGEDESPIDRLETALKCLPQYDPSRSLHADPVSSFRYWKIRDYAYAYRSKLTTPLQVFHLNFLVLLLSFFGTNREPCCLLLGSKKNNLNHRGVWLWQASNTIFD